MPRLRLVRFVVLAASLSGALGAQGAQEQKVALAVYGPLLEPLPDAEVTIRRSDWSELRTGRTDGSGLFLFEAPAGEWFHCCAAAPGLQAGCAITKPLVASASSPEMVELRLLPAARVRGVVRDDAGQPVAGAEVIAAMDHAPGTFFRGRPEFAITDANGVFLLSHVLLGEITLRASAAGHELGETPTYVRGDAVVDVALKRGGGRELAVVVEGVPAERLPDITCTWFARRSAPRVHVALPPRLARAGFDERGRCFVRGLPRDADLTMIRLEGAGMRFHPQWQEAAADQGSEVTFRLEAITGPRPTAATDGAPATDAPAPADEPPAPPVGVPANATLRGVLRGKDGRARGGVRVRVYSEGPGWREAITAPDGSFGVLAEYPRGAQVSFELHHPDWVLDDPGEAMFSFGGAVWRQHKPGTVHELVVLAALKIRGTVEAPRGQSADGLTVLLEQGTLDRTALPRRMSGLAYTGANGEFGLGGVRPSREKFWLSVRSLRGTADLGPLDADDLKRELRLRLEAPFTITGKVVGKSGKPVPGARVELSEQGRLPGLTTIGTEPTLADAQGRFVFRGMAAGKYEVAAAARGAERTRSKPIELGGKRREVDQKVTLPIE